MRGAPSGSEGGLVLLPGPVSGPVLLPVLYNARSCTTTHTKNVRPTLADAHDLARCD